MAEAAPTRAGSPPVADAYRPLSGLAITGFVLAVLSGSIFLLNSPWLVPFLPVPALVISLIARRQVRRSEGTLAGHNLASLGAAVSLVIILIYLTMNLTAYWIVRRETVAFVEGFMKKSAEGREGPAFLDTVDPSKRHITFKPDDIRRIRYHYPSPGNPDDSLYDAFRRAPMTAAILRYRDRVAWKHVGQEESAYALGSYTVKQRYHLTTPEMSGDVIFVLRSEITKGASGPRREWRIDLPNTQFAPDPQPLATQYGTELRDAQQEASKVLRGVLQTVSHGDRQAAARLLGPNPDAELKANFSQVFDILRKDGKPSLPVKLQPKDAYVLNDSKEGEAWTLDYFGVIDTGVREVELRFRLQTDDARKGPESWYVGRAKFLGERKKMPMEAGMGGMGSSMASPGGAHKN